MMEICEHHLAEAWLRVTMPAPGPVSMTDASCKRAWADVPCDAAPSGTRTCSSAEEDTARPTIGRGDLRGVLNEFQTFICRKILAHEPFLIATGHFVRNEHGEKLDLPAEGSEPERIVVSISNPTENLEDLLEGIVIARASCQHYVGRNLFLQEQNQVLPPVKKAEEEGDQWKDHTTFLVSRVKHFPRGLLWPHVQECTQLEKTQADIVAALTIASGLALQEQLTLTDLASWLNERIDQNAEEGVLFTLPREAPHRIAAEERDRRGGQSLGYVKSGAEVRGHDYKRADHRSCTDTWSH